MPDSPATASASRDRLVAIALMCGAVFSFSFLDGTAKWLAVNSGIPPLQIVWARYTAAMLLTLLFINPWNTPGVLRTAKPLMQGARSVLLLASTALNFVALQYLQLAETVAIIFATPLLVALLAGPMLGEWVGPRRLIAIVVGFIGVLVVLRPGFSGLHPAAFLSVLGCVCYALYAVWTRQLAAHDSTATTMVYSNVVGAAVMAFVIPSVWVAPQHGSVWLMMIGLGVFGAFGHWLLILAHRKAPAGILAPFIYSQLGWMLGLGWLLFDQWPDRWTLVGSLIVVASGLYLIHRERVRAREAAQGRAVKGL